MQFSVLLFVVSGCVPVTKYVRTANVPSATGETLTLPVQKAVELSGSVAFNDSIDPLTHHFPQRLVYDVNDPLVLRSTLHMEGLARVKVHPNIVLGAHGNVDLYRTGDFLNLPFDDRPSWGVGPNIAFHFQPADENLTIGASAALTFTSVPWNTWTLKSSAPAYPYASSFNAQLYDKTISSADIAYLYRFSVGASYVVAKHIEPFGGFSIQNGLRNTGFSNYDFGTSTLTASDLNLVPYMGVGLNVEPAFVRAQFYLPINVIGQGNLDFGSQVQMGVSF